MGTQLWPQDTVCSFAGCIWVQQFQMKVEGTFVVGPPRLVVSMR